MIVDQAESSSSTHTHSEMDVWQSQPSCKGTVKVLRILFCLVARNNVRVLLQIHRAQLLRGRVAGWLGQCDSSLARYRLFWRVGLMKLAGHTAESEFQATCDMCVKWRIKTSEAAREQA